MESTDSNSLIEIYNHIGEEERHFNQLELEYRKLASQWLLATLGAVGLLLSKEFSTQINVYVLIALICGASSLGIFVLFIMDIKVYHTLLHAIFKEGIKLEIKHNTLFPPIRINMYLAATNGDVVNKVMCFYFFSILLLVCIANLSIYQFCEMKHFYIYIISFILIVLLFIYMKIKPVKFEELDNYLYLNI